MPLKQQLTADMKEAMKARKMMRLNTIRFLMSEIKNAEIDGASDDDASLQKIIASQVKKTKDALQEFVNAGRTETVEEEEAKIAIMESYLPKQLSVADLEKIVREVLQNEVETTNQGQLIGKVVKQVAGQADGKRVQEMIQKVLNEK